MGLAKEILQGDVRATAKLMRDVEDGLPGITEELKGSTSISVKLCSCSLG